MSRLADGHGGKRAVLAVAMAASAVLITGASCRMLGGTSAATTPPTTTSSTQPATRPAPVAVVRAGKPIAGVFNVRDFGATGDGKTLDNPAINAAIEAAAASGGGTVRFPAGTYLSYSVRLRSNITLELQQGAVLQAADMRTSGGTGFDFPEPNAPADRYEDFGHSHWHNSLIWGDNVHDVSIIGPGMIDGKGLSNGLGGNGAGGAGGRGRGGNGGGTGRGGVTQPTTDGTEENTPQGAGNENADQGNANGAGNGFGPGRGGFGPGRGGADAADNPDADPFANIGRGARGGAGGRGGARGGRGGRGGGGGGGGGFGPGGRGPTTFTAERPLPNGVGNKAIALKNSRNIVLSGFSLFRGGHFGLLATGVNNLTIDGLKVDTNRDGFDIDSCRNVRVANTTVNSPWDDGICLKSSFGLGSNRACENVTITNCLVSGGFELGAMLDGTYRPVGLETGRRAGHTGRIKFGTESNGGFKNITISNIVFDDCQGLAMEAVDGGVIDNVSVSNITMRNIVSTPIFIRLGSRNRGPADVTKTGEIKHINISDIVAQNKSAIYACIISGIPGHNIEDVRISNIRIIWPGGAPSDIVQRIGTVPENETGYPEPSMFGAMPTYGFFIRHVDGIRLHEISMATTKPDHRPTFYLDDVSNAVFDSIQSPRLADAPNFYLHKVWNFLAHNVQDLPDVQLASIEQLNLSPTNLSGPPATMPSGATPAAGSATTMPAMP